MPLFGWRKRKEQTSKHVEALPKSTAKSPSSPSTSAAQVLLRGLSANEANTQEDGRQLTKDVRQPNVTLSTETGE